MALDALSADLMRFAAMLLGSLLVGTAPGQVHRVINERNYHTFSTEHPVLARIAPGDRVITKTVDSAGWDDQGIRRTVRHGNPLTGPFYIEGAEHGDALVVHIDTLRLNRTWGYTAYRIGPSALTPEYVEHELYPNHYKPDVVLGGPANLLKGRADLLPWVIDLERQTVRLREPISQAARMEFPARPMLGCIGAPPLGEPPTSGPAGAYGGNMDYWEVREGATVYLPVFHRGGYLLVGDGHALQGHAEVVGSGVETSMDLAFTVGLIKQARLTGVRLENREYLISVGSAQGEPLNQAVRLATTDMVRWLQQEHRLEPWAAHQVIGVQAVYDIATMAGTVALKIPKTALQPD